MIIYVDIDNHCYVDNDGSRKAVETDYFNGKCKEFIEGYCYEEIDQSVKIYPWKTYSNLDEIQTAVDRTQNEADADLADLIEQIYLEDLEMIENV